MFGHYICRSAVQTVLLFLIVIAVIIPVILLGPWIYSVARSIREYQIYNDMNNPTYCVVTGVEPTFMQPGCINYRVEYLDKNNSNKTYLVVTNSKAYTVKPGFAPVAVDTEQGIIEKCTDKIYGVGRGLDCWYSNTNSNKVATKHSRTNIKLAFIPAIFISVFCLYVWFVGLTANGLALIYYWTTGNFQGCI